MLWFPIDLGRKVKVPMHEREAGRGPGVTTYSYCSWGDRCVGGMERGKFHQGILVGVYRHSRLQLLVITCYVGNATDEVTITAATVVKMVDGASEGRSEIAEVIAPGRAGL